MADNTTATMDAALKQLYRGENYRQTTYKDRPLLATLPKEEQFGGRNMPIVQNFAHGVGGSASFPKAQTNASAEKYEDFLLTRVSEYQVATITNEAALASEKDEYSFVAGLKAKVDGALNAISNRLETFLFRGGTGSIGQISSTSNVATNSITLSDIEEITNFEVGMKLVASAADGEALRNAGATETIAGLDRSLGTLTSTSAAWNTTIAALAASDFLYVEGDASNNASPSSANWVKVAGLAAWLPTSVTSTLFFNVNRQLDSVRLGGNRLTSTSATLEEALIDGQSVASREGGRITHEFINHARYRQLVKELGSKVTYDKLSAQGPRGAMADVSFNSVVVHGDKGTINVLSANKCPSATAYALDMSTWKFHSLGPAPMIIDLDGLRSRAVSNADSFECRVAYYANLGCTWPGANTRITLPS